MACHEPLIDEISGMRTNGRNSRSTALMAPFACSYSDLLPVILSQFNDTTIHIKTSFLIYCKSLNSLYTTANNSPNRHRDRLLSLQEGRNKSGGKN